LTTAGEQLVSHFKKVKQLENELAPVTKQGVAYCLLPKLQIANKLANGELINISPEHELIETLYWHSWVLVKGSIKKYHNK
jgi:hypothetical protein